MNGASPSKISLSSLRQPRELDLRLPLAIMLTILLAVYFWSQSRYPALDEKMLMGEATPLSGLAFDIAVEIMPGDGFWQHLWANSVNWVATNINGMSFGVLFGAMALTLLSLLQKRSFQNGFANSALGAVIGAPLGVCVNCAAPIALGLHAGRMRLETTLSALLASPTLNVIVVTMSFALLPIHVAAVKLFASLMMVLVGVPLLCRFFLTQETAATHADKVAAQSKQQTLTGLSGWLMRNLAPRDYVAGRFGPARTAVWFIKNYARNFIFVFIVTVPMMFLAALLGALFVEVFSPNAIGRIMPREGALLILGGMVALALILSFAPAPIALDVILTAVLLSIGLSNHYAAVAVIALGSFSVYAFFIIWKAISLRTALALWGMVLAAAVCAGCLTIMLNAPAKQYKIASYERVLEQGAGISWPALDKPIPEKVAAAPAVAAQSLVFSQSGDAQIASIMALDVAARPARNTGPVFSRLTGGQIGIDAQGQITALPRFLSFGFEGGIAAGDIDGDGWIDLALRQSNFTRGIAIYRNVGGRFVRQDFDLGPIDDAPALNVALVDINGDTSLDLIIATDGAGNYMIPNQAGTFSANAIVKLPGNDQARTRSFAFADFNRDGRIDIALGNNALTLGGAGLRKHSSKVAENTVLFNQGQGTFEPSAFGRFSGQTLSLLASDFDGDGTQDLLTGNDVANTDDFTLFDGGPNPRTATGPQVPFPYRTNSSMSYDEGDWNNDLRPDYYGGQIANNARPTTASGRLDTLAKLCGRIGDDLGWGADQRRTCLGKMRGSAQLKGAYQSGLQSGCDVMRDPKISQLCAARALFQYFEAERSAKPDIALHQRCIVTMHKLSLVQDLCQALLIPLAKKPSPSLVEEELGPVRRRANILFTANQDGSYTDDAKAQGVHLAGWTWDAKFSDLDQDGWQDLLVMTGWWGRAPDAHTNRFYRNRAGKFEDATKAFGFTDLMPSFSAVRFDFDRDGDIDVVRSLAGTHVVVHRNERPAGPALWVHLRQSGGNSYGIGGRVTICTDGALQIARGPCQTRPIKASGGFASFDPIAAHFGLGAAKTVSLIVVDWPDASRSIIHPAALDHGEIVIHRK